MKIVKVDLNPNGFTCVCSMCNNTIGAYESSIPIRYTGERINPIRYADLDGEPFKSYICKYCHDNNLPEEYKVKLQLDSRR